MVTHTQLNEYMKFEFISRHSNHRKRRESKKMKRKKINNITRIKVKEERNHRHYNIKTRDQRRRRNAKQKGLLKRKKVIDTQDSHSGGGRRFRNILLCYKLEFRKKNDKKSYYIKLLFIHKRQYMHENLIRIVRKLLYKVSERTRERESETSIKKEKERGK